MSRLDRRLPWGLELTTWRHLAWAWVGIVVTAAALGFAQDTLRDPPRPTLVHVVAPPGIECRVSDGIAGRYDATVTCATRERP